MSDTKRILVWLYVVIWCLLSLCVDVRAQGTIDLSPLPEFTEQKCEPVELATNIMVIKKKMLGSVPAGGGGTAPVYVDSASGVQEAVMPGGSGSGNLIIVVTYLNSTCPHNTPTDTLSTTYSAATACQDQNEITISMQTWYGRTTASGANTVSVSGVYVTALEYSGPNASPLDDSEPGVNTSNSTSVASGQITTTNADDVLIGVSLIYDEGAITWTEGDGWTERIDVNQGANKLQVQEKTVSSTGNYTSTSTLSGATYWLSHVVSFKGN
jgi:hypothetical protein